MVSKVPRPRHFLVRPDTLQNPNPEYPRVSSWDFSEFGVKQTLKSTTQRGDRKMKPVTHLLYKISSFQSIEAQNSEGNPPNVSQQLGASAWHFQRTDDWGHSAEPTDLKIPV